MDSFLKGVFYDKKTVNIYIAKESKRTINSVTIYPELDTPTEKTIEEWVSEIEEKKLIRIGDIIE